MRMRSRGKVIVLGTYNIILCVYAYNNMCGQKKIDYNLWNMEWNMEQVSHLAGHFITQWVAIFDFVCYIATYVSTYIIAIWL